MARLLLIFLTLLVLAVSAKRKSKRPKRPDPSVTRLPPFSVVSPRDDYAEDYEEGRVKKTKKKPKKLERWIDMLDGSVDGKLKTTNQGAGVTLFVVDSGCRGDVSVTLRPNDTVSPEVDETGHGMFVHAMLKTLVPDAKTVCVKVFDKDGTCPTLRVAKAFDYVIATCLDPSKCVINFSGQSSLGRDIAAAVLRLKSAGIVLVVAAGNYVYSDVSQVSDFQMDACNWAPSGLPSVIAAGATDDRGVVASWSKIGPCVTSFGPGDGVVVAGRYLYGTSFGVASVTAGRVQCASSGSKTCGDDSKVTGFAPLAVRKFGGLVKKTTSDFTLLF